jgi:hypothetical protein
MGAVAMSLACAGETPGPEGEAVQEAFPTSLVSVGASASFETEDTLPSALKAIAVEAVRGRTGPGGVTFYIALRAPGGADHLSRQIGQRTFPLALRVNSPDLTQYPCTSCHEGQEIVGDEAERDEEAVHHNIQPVHPEETGAQCTTCHAVADVGTLRLENGGTASINHPYRLCAQCHFPEVDSWANGAHGKRLVGWRGRRVVMGCTDCHNPHSPATEMRIPYPGVELPAGLVGEEAGETAGETGEESSGELGGGAHD